jgi:4-hydroxy-tetrahydrodipicolinate synthase
MLKGLIPACVTPLDLNENIDVEAVKMHMDYLLDCGVEGLLYCGTTGEFNCLSNEKRKLLIETAVSNNKGRAIIMVGIGATSTAQAIENAKIAENAGADYLLLMTPWFEKPSLQGIEDYIYEITKVTKLPIMLYHHPYRTYFDWPVAHIAEMYFKFKGKVIGIKDSSCDYNRLIELKKLVDDEFKIFFECPDKFQQSKKLGAVGCIDGLANLNPLEAVGSMNGDINFINQYKKARNVLATSKNYIAVLKAGLRLIGINVGTPFHPNHQVEAIDLENIKNVLVETGRINIKSQYENVAEPIAIVTNEAIHNLKVPMAEVLISKAPDNQRQYRHHPSIIYFQDKFFSAWSEGFRNEDSRGQAIGIATSLDGLDWLKQSQIIPLPNQKTYYSNGGFVIINKDLYLLVTEYSSARYAQGSRERAHCWADLKTSFYVLNNNNWVKTDHTINGFYVNEAPRLDANQNFFALGMDEFHNAVAFQSSIKNPFEFEKIILSNTKDGVQLSEPSWAILQNQKVILFRDLGVNRYLWQSVYLANENKFTKPNITNYPNGNSKLFAFPIFNNGTAIISNATIETSHSRCKLHLGIAKNGEKFEHMIILKDNVKCEPKFKGLHKMSGFQYPNAFIHNNNLHIIFSINKEDIATIKISLVEIEQAINNKTKTLVTV